MVYSDSITSEKFCLSHKANRRPPKSVLSLTGFTLVEGIISIAILGFITLSIYGVLRVGDMTWRTEMNLMDMQQQVRLAMDGMTREIRQADTTSEPNGGSTIYFTIPNVSDTIEYYLSNNQIIREYPKDSGTTKVLARDISSLNFSLSSDEITISITAQKTVRGRPLQFSLKQIVRLRN